jgi:hypothetical protein
MCYGGRQRYETWDRETYAAPEAERGDLRASDAERDAAVESLRTHAQAGRLTSDELEDRVAAALAATTRADLAKLHVDLPAPPAPRRSPAARPEYVRRSHAHAGFPFVPIAILLVVVWAVSGAGYFWPLWPLVWFGFIALRHGGHTRVTGNTRRTWSHPPHR